MCCCGTCVGPSHLLLLLGRRAKAQGTSTTLGSSLWCGQLVSTTPCCSRQRSSRQRRLGRLLLIKCLLCAVGCGRKRSHV